MLTPIPANTTTPATTTTPTVTVERNRYAVAVGGAA